MSALIISITALLIACIPVARDWLVRRRPRRALPAVLRGVQGSHMMGVGRLLLARSGRRSRR